MSFSVLKRQFQSAEEKNFTHIYIFKFNLIGATNALLFTVIFLLNGYIYTFMTIYSKNSTSTGRISVINTHTLM